MKPPLIRRIYTGDESPAYLKGEFSAACDARTFREFEFPVAGKATPFQNVDSFGTWMVEEFLRGWSKSRPNLRY